MPLMLSPQARGAIEFGGIVATKIARTAMVGEPVEIVKQWVEMLESDN